MHQEKDRTPPRSTMRLRIAGAASLFVALAAAWIVWLRHSPRRNRKKAKLENAVRITDAIEEAERGLDDAAGSAESEMSSRHGMDRETRINIDHTVSAARSRLDRAWRRARRRFESILRITRSSYRNV